MTFPYFVSCLLCLIIVQRLASAAPTDAPTYFPTSIPVPVSVTPPAQIPIAQHELLVVQNSGDALIRLKMYDSNSFKVTYEISSVPISGTLYQLSQVFSAYGYEPKAGDKISTPGIVVTGSNNRVYYKRPSPDAITLNKWDAFNYTVISPEGIRSYYGTVTLVPPTGVIVGSGFLLDNEGWTIEGNKASSSSAKFEPYSRGNTLNRYIVASDDLVNVASAGMPDSSLWYFVAPSKFLGNVGIAYGGSIQFAISSFAGDFTKLNSDQTYVVLLECKECNGPVTKGITLGYSMASLALSPNGPFLGKPMTISIPLKETGPGTGVSIPGWVKDSQNSLLPWSPASKCDIIQVLSRLSKIKILGDYTTWYETVALDDIKIVNTKGQLPICAMSRPDASICNC